MIVAYKCESHILNHTICNSLTVLGTVFLIVSLPLTAIAALLVMAGEGHRK